MYLYVFEQNILGPLSSLGPGKILVLPKAPMRNALITHEASVIFSFWEKEGCFKLLKSRFYREDNMHELATKFLGIRLFDDGFFVSDKDFLIFTLKYQGLTTEKVVDFPLI